MSTIYTSLAKAGYEKWRSLLEPHATAGLPDWNRLPEGSKLAWEDVARAVVDAHISEGEPV